MVDMQRSVFMGFTVTNLTCNHMKNPVGMDELPHFSFGLVSEDPADLLCAYHIVVSDRNGIVWDSGRVEKDEQLMIPYGGQPLAPETDYTWKVCAWNQKGERTESETASFMTGRMKPFGWEAKWITPEFAGDVLNGNRLWGNYSLNPYLRKEFILAKPVKEAVLFISGVGYYECYINGVSVKDTVLDPAFTAYDQATMYKVHKIENLTEGNNAIAISLGDGMYNCSTHDVWNNPNASWRDVPKCICVLKITYTDGTQEKIVSDPAFKATMGNYTANDLRTLDEYDATKEFDGWTEPGFDDASWPQAVITRPTGGELVAQYTTPMKVVRELAPVSVEKLSDTMWIADAGENIAGWAEISLTAPRGTVVELVYAENFDEDYNVIKNHLGEYEPSNKPLFQKSRYIASGKGKETWHSCFKYNGFRYIRITCETGIPADFALTIQEVRTDLTQTGSFTCSDPMLNKIQEITCRATRTNFHNMPTDCPTREKNGWTGDAQLSCEQLLYNYDGFAAYNRWMDDVLRAQRPTGQLPGVIPSADWGYNWGNGPAWDSVCTEIPYDMYLFGGDKQVLAKMYPAVKKYLDYYDSMAVDGIAAYGLSDWCRPDKEPWHEPCELNVTTVAYACQMTRVASRMAALLGKPEEAAAYREKAEMLKAQFRKQFIVSEPGKTALINCTPGQTALACVLYFELYEGEAEKQWFYQELLHKIHQVEDHMDVGILGAKFVANVLIREGDADLYFKTVTNPTCPSYAHMVNSGASTLWEDWYGGASQNHHMYGDVSACMYKALAGLYIDEEKPAFKNTLFKPQFVDSITDVDAWHLSPYGKVASSWKKEGNTVQMTVAVPTNCTGQLHLPKNAVFAASGETVSFFGAGTHTFEIILK